MLVLRSIDGGRRQYGGPGAAYVPGFWSVNGFKETSSTLIADNSKCALGKRANLVCQWV